VTWTFWTKKRASLHGGSLEITLTVPLINICLDKNTLIPLFVRSITVRLGKSFHIPSIFQGKVGNLTIEIFPVYSRVK